MIDNKEELKKQAGIFAAKFVKSNMIVGLGVGSTAIHAINEIGRMLRDGEIENIIGIPCSVSTSEAARKAEIPLSSLSDHPIVDITIDGADEVDPQFNLIKGGGGALFREKMVAKASKQEIIIVDDSKLSEKLGTQWAVPIEVARFGWKTHIAFLENLEGKAALRLGADQSPFISDQGNYFIDCNFGPIKDLNLLAEKLKMRTGIVEHGLFLGLATKIIVAGREGIKVLEK